MRGYVFFNGDVADLVRLAVVVATHGAALLCPGVPSGKTGNAAEDRKKRFLTAWSRQG